VTRARTRSKQGSFARLGELLDYEYIKKSAQKTGRYDKLAKEVAARTVIKQIAKEAKEARPALDNERGSGGRVASSRRN
jgi:hypothetical protein